jgi:hypothetical protein
MIVALLAAVSLGYHLRMVPTGGAIPETCAVDEAGHVAFCIKNKLIIENAAGRQSVALQIDHGGPVLAGYRTGVVAGYIQKDDSGAISYYAPEPFVWRNGTLSYPEADAFAELTAVGTDGRVYGTVVSQIDVETLRQYRTLGILSGGKVEAVFESSLVVAVANGNMAAGYTLQGDWKVASIRVDGRDRDLPITRAGQDSAVVGANSRGDLLGFCGHDIVIWKAPAYRPHTVRIPSLQDFEHLAMDDQGRVVYNASGHSWLWFNNGGRRLDLFVSNLGRNRLGEFRGMGPSGHILVLVKTNKGERLGVLTPREGVRRLALSVGGKRSALTRGKGIGKSLGQATHSWCAHERKLRVPLRSLESDQ